MIENLLYFSPILLLSVGSVFLALCHWQDVSVGMTFRIAKIFTILSFCAAIIFYNRSAFPTLMFVNKFSLLFLTITYIAMIGTLFLSKKWYAGMNMNGALFCCGLLLSGISGFILITSQHLLLTVGGMYLLLACNYLLFIRADKKKDVYLSSKLYAVSAVFVSLFILVLVYGVFEQQAGFDYHSLSIYFENETENTVAFMIAIGLTLVFVFLLGLAPLHFWYTETTGQIVLPVFTYFTLIPISTCWGAFIKLNTYVLSAMEPRLILFYQGLGVLTMFVGAIGACSGKNIRKIFAYGAVYQQGIVFLMLQHFTSEALNTAFIYLNIYILAMYGICSCLYGLKNKGEYLFMLSDFEGTAFRRPYLAFAMTIFLFSLIGFPPFLGFLGLFSVVNNLVLHNNFYQLAFLLIALVTLTYSYLQIIKTLYFENSRVTFDRVDRGIYMVVLLTVLVMMFLVLQPHFLVQNVEWILEGVLTWRQ